MSQFRRLGAAGRNFWPAPWLLCHIRAALHEVAQHPRRFLGPQKQMPAACAEMRHVDPAGAIGGAEFHHRALGQRGQHLAQAQHGQRAQKAPGIDAGGPCCRGDATAILRDHEVSAAVAVALPGGTTGAQGVLAAYATGPRAFRPEDVHFLQAVANLLATLAGQPMPHCANPAVYAR